jgi:NAD(P)-dependent dehydrogenase (short-subunit alcohol dehydrogenase family)
MNLANAVALVTGGSGGLGSRISELLSQNGVNVAVSYLGGKDRRKMFAEI